MKNLLYAVIGLHYLVFISFVLTAFLGIAVLPWFVAITLIALIIRVIVSQDECPLTTLENHIRIRLNLPLSRAFLKDYILNPRDTFRSLYKGLRNE